MVCFQNGKIIAGRNDAAVEHDQVLVTGGEHNRSLGASAKGETSEKKCAVVSNV
jgi:hypothetical protein